MFAGRFTLEDAEAVCGGETGDDNSLAMMLMNQGYATLRQGDQASAHLGTSGRLDRDAAIRLALGESPTVLRRRESEVATLITEGLTNQQIATRLHLSERTVESHVRSTPTRLGFTTRTQIAAHPPPDDPRPRARD